MLWMIFQGLVVFAVVASNIHWQWTPNGYLATGLGILAALLATAAITGVVEAIRARRAAV
jgi:hypothetical protein